MVPFLIRRTSWIPIPLYAPLIWLFRYLSADEAYDPDSRRIQNIFDYLAHFFHFLAFGSRIICNFRYYFLFHFFPIRLAVFLPTYSEATGASTTLKQHVESYQYFSYYFFLLLTNFHMNVLYHLNTHSRFCLLLVLREPCVIFGLAVLPRHSGSCRRTLGGIRKSSNCIWRRASSQGGTSSADCIKSLCRKQPSLQSAYPPFDPVVYISG